MEQLIKDKQFFKLIAGRSRLKGEYNREYIKQKYEEKDWLKQKVQLEQIMEVIYNVETMCHRFIINRIISILYFVLGFLSFMMFIVGIIVNIQITKQDKSIKVYNFWDLSWPYFNCFFFIPMIALGCFFLNKHYLDKYEKIISSYFAEININFFEKQSVVWKVGEQCSYLDISQVSKLRSKSREYTSNIIQNSFAKKDIEHIRNDLQMQQYQTDTPKTNDTNINISCQQEEINSQQNNQKEFDDIQSLNLSSL